MRNYFLNLDNIYQYAIEGESVSIFTNKNYMERDRNVMLFLKFFLFIYFIYNFLKRDDRQLKLVGGHRVIILITYIKIKVIGDRFVIFNISFSYFTRYGTLQFFP